MKNQKTPKQPPLTKEQLAQKAKLIAEAQKFKKLIREDIFPILSNGAKSLEHAQQVCEILKTVIVNSTNQYWQDKTLSDLKLDEELTSDKNVKDRDVYLGLIEALKDVSIEDSQKLLQGMGGALDGYVRLLARSKDFSEVKVEEIIND